MQRGFLKGPEMTGLFIPDLPASVCPNTKRSCPTINIPAFNDDPSPHHPHHYDRPGISHPLSSKHAQNEREQKIQDDPNSSSPTLCPSNIGHQHANEILGEYSLALSFSLLPNKYNSLQEFGNKGKKHKHPICLFH